MRRPQRRLEHRHLGYRTAEGVACCTPAGNNWFSVKGDIPIGLTVSNLRLTALARLNASTPARPTLVSAQVGATATVGGTGQFSGVPVTLAATVAGGAILLDGDVVKTGFSWGGVGANLTIHLQLKILPSHEPLEAESARRST